MTMKRHRLEVTETANPVPSEIAGGWVGVSSRSFSACQRKYIADCLAFVSLKDGGAITKGATAMHDEILRRLSGIDPD